MAILDRLFRRGDDRAALNPLYSAIVRAGRAPHWYVEGRVADSIDGRFDMLATILAIVLVRMESSEALRAPSVHLTELFIDDMDGQLREIGIGDVVVGKHVGKLLGALGGRIGAMREGMAPDGDLPAALVRNLYRAADPGADALAHVEARLRALAASLAATSDAALLAGTLEAA